MNRKERRVAESQNKGKQVPGQTVPHDVLLQAVNLHQAGKLDEAEQAYRKLLASYPHDPFLLNLMGMVHAKRGRYEEAIRLMGEAIAIKPDYIDAYNERGEALIKSKKYAEAMANYDKAIAINPHYADAHLKRGVALYYLERYHDALASYDKTLAINPHYAEAYNNRSNALRQLNQYSDAVASCDKAIAINPRYAEAYNNRGLTFYILKQYGEALKNYDKAIAINPAYAEAYYNRGLLCHDLAQYSEALANYDKAIAINPHYAEAYNNRGITFYYLNQPGETLANHNKAIAINPSYAEAYYNRGVALQELMRYDEALESFDKTITINPGYADAHCGKGLLKLALGQYEEGWKLYEWRWKSKNTLINGSRTFQKPLWLGKESLAGKTILLHAEQGFGDTLQFCRYAPLVAASGAKVLLEVPGSLMGLLATLDGSLHILEQGKPLPAFDFHCPLMSLPLAFGTTVETIPSEPYLKAQPEFIKKWQPVLNETLGDPSQSFRIGLCWAGGQRPDNTAAVSIDSRRSFHFKRLKPLLDNPHASFVSLQLGPPKDEIEDERVKDISSRLKNWSDTAAVMSLLDLVISVDTSVCHLAGALGKKTFLFNRYDTCWRWLLGRDDSPWYPSLTQFRQNTPGDWAEVIARMKTELEIFSVKPLGR